jgi:hypothetical protein
MKDIETQAEQVRTNLIDDLLVFSHGGRLPLKKTALPSVNASVINPVAENFAVRLGLAERFCLRDSSEQRSSR